jgi:hypothetical protein
MTRHLIRLMLGTSSLVVILAVVGVTVAADYPGAYLGVVNRGGVVRVATAHGPGWADLMSLLDTCVPGSDCTVMVCCAGHTYAWTADGPVLAVADPSAFLDVVAERGSIGGGSQPPESVPGVPPHKLMP